MNPKDELDKIAKIFPPIKGKLFKYEKPAFFVGLDMRTEDFLHKIMELHTKGIKLMGIIPHEQDIYIVLVHGDDMKQYQIRMTQEANEEA
ncbi:MAG: hypothetical protein OXC46_03380 [Thaumarchaeota archaeon]|nr:hypothetical protein [Nitrososphaerota archaeon]